MDIQPVMDEINQLKQEVQSQAKRDASLESLDAQALLKQIDQWKKETIERVNRIAADVSKQVENIFSRKEDYQQLDSRVETIRKELTDQQESESFVEMDIDRWKKQLRQMKADLNAPSTKSKSPPQLRIQNVDWSTIIGIDINRQTAGTNRHT